MSKLIKSTQYISAHDYKLLETIQYIAPEMEVEIDTEHHERERHRVREAEYEQIRKQIMEDAAGVADEHVRQAIEEAEQIVIRAKEEAEQWWNDRRQDDQQLIEIAKLDGFEKGYQEGLEQAEEATKEKVEAMLQEAKAVLQQAYQSKDLIIQEAEPFLVELSSAVAEKIIDKALSNDPAYALELIKKQLTRRREQGTITLCVAPQHFSFIQAAREELSYSIDSQAELQIIPDSTVSDWGCVIRSVYGSIDARIDTQLVEIKKQLQHIANHPEEQTTEGSYA